MTTEIIYLLLQHMHNKATTFIVLQLVGPHAKSLHSFVCKQQSDYKLFYDHTETVTTSYKQQLNFKVSIHLLVGIGLKAAIEVSAMAVVRFTYQTTAWGVFVIPLLHIIYINKNVQFHLITYLWRSRAPTLIHAFHHI